MEQSDIEEDEIDLGELFRKLKQNRFRIFFTTLLVVLTAAIYLYFTPLIYSSSVTISLDNQESSKLGMILPPNLLGNTKDDERLQLAKVTLQSKKFIGTIIDKVKTDRDYFIQKNFKKNEVSKFSNLKIDITYIDKNLYEKFFEIIPQNSKEFLLKIDAIKYSKVHKYNKRIKNQWFKLRVVKSKGENPFIESYEEEINKYLADFPKLKSWFKWLDRRAYFFKSYDRSRQADLIREKITVSTLSDTILKIVYSDTMPKQAQKVVQEIAETYIKYNLKIKTSEMEQTLYFLDGQIIDVKQNLKTKGEKLKDYQQENSTMAAMKSSDGLLEQVENKTELAKKINLQLQEIQSFRGSLEDGVLSTVSLVSSGIDTSSIQSLMERYRLNDEEIRALHFQQNDISKSVTSNVQISILINELKKAELILQDLRNNFTEEHPQVIEEKNNLFAIESQIHETIVANLDKLQRDKAVAKSTILSNMLMVQDNLENKLSLLESDIRQKKELIQSLPAKKMINQGLQRNFTLSEDIYTFLLQKKIEIEISKSAMIANTKVLEDAHIAKYPDKPNKKLILMVAFILGLILGIAFALIKEFFDTTIRSVADIEKLTDVPVYGVVPLNNNKRFFTEALRHIRTNLQFVLSNNKKCTTLLISSTVAGEGKTTIVSGLGDVLSKANKKVLLIDFDLRKPRLHKELKQRNKIGVSNFLSSDIEYEELIVEVNKNLHFMSAGRIPPNPSELLMSEKLEPLITLLEKKYDYILFDTAPIGSVTDANMLLKHSDIVLLIVKANEAEKTYLTHFNKIIQEKNIKSSGIIFNSVKLYKNKKYGYGYGYGYSYGYGKKENR